MSFFCYFAEQEFTFFLFLNFYSFAKQTLLHLTANDGFEPGFTVYKQIDQSGAKTTQLHIAPLS